MSLTSTRASRLLAAVVLALGVAAASGGHAEAAVPGRSFQGCPSGYVCIYPRDQGWNGGHPEVGGLFYSYGAHNLSNQYGNHYIFNNQYGEALVTLDQRPNGVDHAYLIPAGTAAVYNLTPINSITLIR
jgi:hypothetical protein